MLVTRLAEHERAQLAPPETCTAVVTDGVVYDRAPQRSLERAFDLQSARPPALRPVVAMVPAVESSLALVNPRRKHGAWTHPQGLAHAHEACEIPDGICKQVADGDHRRPLLLVEVAPMRRPCFANVLAHAGTYYLSDKSEGAQPCNALLRPCNVYLSLLMDDYGMGKRWSRPRSMIVVHDWPDPQVHSEAARAWQTAPHFSEQPYLIIDNRGQSTAALQRFTDERKDADIMIDLSWRAPTREHRHHFADYPAVARVVDMTFRYDDTHANLDSVMKRFWNITADTVLPNRMRLSPSTTAEPDGPLRVALECYGRPGAVRDEAVGPHIYRVPWFLAESLYYGCRLPPKG